jgi:PEP-CTERM motif
MGILHLFHPVRGAFAAGFLLSLATAPAQAGSITVFWDDPNFNGYGVSEATAQSANAAGIPIVSIPRIEGNVPSTGLAVTNSLDVGSRVIPVPFDSGEPATVTSNWSATNNSALNGPTDPIPDNLFLVFANPGPSTITINGQPQNVAYDPADVGLSLSFDEAGLADWVLLQVPSNPLVPTSIPVYYPAVSLGTLPAGSNLPFQLFYTLDNPQVFTEPINVELGMPQWNLFFASTVIPEPSTGLLLLLGVGALAATRRERA